MIPGVRRTLNAAPAPVRLTSPANGDQWASGSKHSVTWTADASVEQVTIELSADGDRTWAPLTDAEEGRPASGVPCQPGVTNRFAWRVPDQDPGPCRIRVAPTGASGARGSTAAFRIIPSQECRTYRWEQVTLAAPFAGRDGAGALTFRNRLWLLGGWNPGDRTHFPQICNSEVWSSADGRSWTLEVLKAPWEGRHTAGYAVHAGQMWIVGGDAIQRRYQNDVWSSRDGRHWTLVTDRVPWAPRVLHCTAVHRGRLWVMGGQTLPQFAPEVPEEVFYNDVWSSADGAEWTQVTEHAAWSPRGMVGGMAVFKGRIWMLGGGTYDTPARPDRRYYNDVWSSADGVEWRRHVEFAPWEPRQYHDVAVFDGRLWVMEGWDGRANRNDVWYSADGVNWYELPNTPWAPRHAASVFVHANALWMVAGNNMFPDVWRLVR